MSVCFALCISFENHSVAFPLGVKLQVVFENRVEMQSTKVLP